MRLPYSFSAGIPAAELREEPLLKTKIGLIGTANVNVPLAAPGGMQTCKPQLLSSQRRNFPGEISSVLTG